MKKKLAIVVTHPIQYYAPVFKLLTERGKIEIKVFYTWGEDSIKPKFDPGFGKTIEWDIPLLEGYQYEFLKNISANPGSSSFSGIKNPDAISRIKAFKPDVVLVYGWSNQSHLNIIRHFKGKIPVWFRGDSNLIDQQKGWKQLLRGIFLRWVYSHIDKALYVGSANKAYFKKYGLKDEQLIFVPHAIDNERFAEPRLEEAKQFRKDLNLSEDDILILFAGKFSPKKDPLILMEAFASFKDERLHLLFVGNGELEEKLKTIATEKKPGKVHFLDFQNQQKMPVVYQSCDIFCLPSAGPGETWGLAVNEAMAAGKPVIVSDKVGCAIDLVNPDQNGYIFESGKKEVLKEYLMKFPNRAAAAQKGDASSITIAEWSFLNQVLSIEKGLN